MKGPLPVPLLEQFRRNKLAHVISLLLAGMVKLRVAEAQALDAAITSADEESTLPSAAGLAISTLRLQDGEQALRAVLSTSIIGQTIDTSVANAPAVATTLGDSLEILSSQVTTRGNSAVALSSQGTLTGNLLTLHTYGTSAYGVKASGGGSAAVTDTQITTEGTNAFGLHATGSGSLIRLSGESSIVTTKVGGYGAQSDNGGRVELDGVTVTTSADSGVGVKVYQGGSVQLVGSSISTQGREASGTLLMGKNAANLAVAEIIDSQLSTRGTSAIGVNVNGYASATVQNSQIETTGQNASGIWLAASTTQADVTGVSIDTSGANALGIASRGGTATLRDVDITTRGAQSHGLYSEGATSRIDATDFHITLDNLGAGVFAVSNGNVSLNNGSVTTHSGGIGLYSATGGDLSARSMAVSSDGAGARALVVSNTAKLTLEDVQAIAEGANSSALLSAASASTQVNQVEFKSGVLSAAQGGAIAVRGGALELNLEDATVSGLRLLDVNENVINGNPVAHADVKIVALNSTLDGDIHVAGASTGDAQLSLDHSTLTGLVDGLDQMNLLEGSRWNVTADSSLTNLSNNGTVAFEADSGFKTLTLEGDLSGNGNFVMNTDLAGEQGDLLRVLGSIEGSHGIFIADSGREPNAENGQLLIVDGNGGVGRFALTGRPYVDAGAFRYSLEQQGNDWFLRNTALVPVDPVDPVDPTDPTDPVGPVDPVTPVEPVSPVNPGNPTQPSVNPRPQTLSAGANAALGNQAATSNLWSAQMNALVKRLGELRMGEDNGGVWTRGIGKSFEIDNGDSRGFDQDVHGMEIGADTAIELDGSKLYVGGMVGGARSTQNYGDGGSGEIDSQLLGTYATWLDDNGYYVDAVAKYNRMRNEVKTLANTGERVKGSYDTDGFGADLEVGRHIKLQDGWFVEPQAELTYTHTEGASYTTSNGLEVDSSDADSLQGRVGSLFGKSLKLDNGMNAQPYAKVSYVHEFEGDSTVKVNGYKLENRIDGSRIEVGLGGVLQVSDKAKVSLDMEHAKGDEVEERWAINLGVRYLW
jgi:outer membrane autotransporter protein